MKYREKQHVYTLRKKGKIMFCNFNNPIFQFQSNVCLDCMRLYILCNAVQVLYSVLCASDEHNRNIAEKYDALFTRHAIRTLGHSHLGSTSQ